MGTDSDSVVVVVVGQSRRRSLHFVHSTHSFLAVGVGTLHPLLDRLINMATLDGWGWVEGRVYNFFPLYFNLFASSSPASLMNNENVPAFPFLSVPTSPNVNLLKIHEAAVRVWQAFSFRSPLIRALSDIVFYSRGP